MMETNIHYAAVGAFVIALVASIVLSIIWLSSGFSFQQYTTYKIYMDESVSGLNIDSPVEFNGVNVGSVHTMLLDHNNPQLVTLLLNIKKSTPVTQGTVATIQSRGVTGVAFIALKDKSENLTPLKITNGEKYPVIKTAPSIFMRLDTMLNRLSDNLHDVSVSIQQLLTNENQKNIKDVLANLRVITGNLAANNDKLDKILTNTDKASRELMPLMRSSANAMRMFQMQTLPATYQLLTNLDNITRSLNEITSEMKQNPSVLIRGIQRQSTGPGEKQ